MVESSARAEEHDAHELLQRALPGASPSECYTRALRDLQRQNCLTTRSRTDILTASLTIFDRVRERSFLDAGIRALDLPGRMRRPRRSAR